MDAPRVSMVTTARGFVYDSLAWISLVAVPIERVIPESTLRLLSNLPRDLRGSGAHLRAVFVQLQVN